VTLLDDGHRLFDFLLRCLVALRFGLGDGLSRVVEVKRGTIEVGSLHLQRVDHALLLTELDHCETLAIVGFGEPRVLDLASALEVIHEFVHAPIRLHVDHEDCPTSLFDLSVIEVDGKRRVLGKSVVLELGIVGAEDLVGDLAFSARNDFWWKLRFS
jgi:hypothetical protein